jgi:tRNA(Arg) A34 adenosine deaminase TadA
MNADSNDSSRFMREALRFAVESAASGNGGPFAAVVVKDGEIVGRGSNAVTGQNDPTAHAEVEAIRDACRQLRTFRLDGCEIYCSSEPCPMCLGAIYWARLERIYYANDRGVAAEAGFDDAFIYDEMGGSGGPHRVLIQRFHGRIATAFSSPSSAVRADPDPSCTPSRPGSPVPAAPETAACTAASETCRDACGPVELSPGCSSPSKPPPFLRNSSPASDHTHLPRRMCLRSPAEPRRSRRTPGTPGAACPVP